MTNLTNANVFPFQGDDAPPEQVEDETPTTTHRCDECGRTFSTPQGLGAHRRAHTAPENTVRTKNMGKFASREIVCGYDGCKSRLQLRGYRNHLQSVHSIAATAAVVEVNATIEELETPKGSKAVARRVEQEPAPQQETGRDHGETLSVEDACTGMLLGMTGLETIPLNRLADLIRWARETERLVDSLT